MLVRITEGGLSEPITTQVHDRNFLFSEFKKKQLLQLKGSTLVIRSRPSLERIVQF